jgi:hypothetical protein
MTTAEEGTVEGPLAGDQTAASADFTSYAVAQPAPVSPSGSTGSFTREIWTTEEVGAEDDLAVVSSTSLGTFALTGLVIDESTGGPVTGAQVRLKNQASGAIVVSATTDSMGAFAFVNVTPVSNHLLEITRTGFGAVTITDLQYAADETYEQTVEMGSSPQTLTARNAADPAPLSATLATSFRYDSDGRVPPFLTVASFPTDQSCAPAGSSYTTRRWPWRFYVLHTMQPEIGGSAFPGGAFKEASAKAVGAAIQNYAWFARRFRAATAGGADVNNTTQYQCFKPFVQVRTSFRRWVGDVLDERIVTSDRRIQNTEYRAGTYNCVESGLHAQNNNVLSQLGAKARDEQCGVDDWRHLDEYYYTGTVDRGLNPPRPDTSFSRVSGGIKFAFPSKVGSSRAGWRYVLERTASTGIGVVWAVIYNRGWSARQRTVPTSFTYSTNETQTYRVKACNPTGCSTYSSFNSDNPISPG